MVTPVDRKALAKVVKYVKANPSRLVFTDVVRDNVNIVEIWDTLPAGAGAAKLGEVVQSLGDVLALLLKDALNAAGVKTTRAGYRLPVAPPKVAAKPEKVARDVKSAKTARAALGGTKRGTRVPARKRAANGRKKAEG